MRTSKYDVRIHDEKLKELSSKHDMNDEDEWELAILNAAIARLRPAQSRVQVVGRQVKLGIKTNGGTYVRTFGPAVAQYFVGIRPAKNWSLWAGKEMDEFKDVELLLDMIGKTRNGKPMSWDFAGAPTMWRKRSEGER